MKDAGVEPTDDILGQALQLDQKEAKEKTKAQVATLTDELAVFGVVPVVTGEPPQIEQMRAQLSALEWAQKAKVKAAQKARRLAQRSAAAASNPQGYVESQAHASRTLLFRSQRSPVMLLQNRKEH